MKFRLFAAAAASLVLAACGSNENASTEAQADTVEISADEAMAPVQDQPVADPAASMTAEDTAAQAEAAMEEEQASVDQAGDEAAATAGAAMDEMYGDTQ